MKDIPGEIRISGYTDNQPLDSELYRSKWDLSAQRAVSVAQEMVKVPGFDHERLEVRGMADTHPVASNETVAGRAKNRRVEISILQGKPLYSDEVPAVAGDQPATGTGGSTGKANSGSPQNGTGANQQ